MRLKSFIHPTTPPDFIRKPCTPLDPIVSLRQPSSPLFSSRMSWWLPACLLGGTFDPHVTGSPSQLHQAEVT